MEDQTRLATPNENERVRNIAQYIMKVVVSIHQVKDHNDRLLRLKKKLQ